MEQNNNEMTNDRLLQEALGGIRQAVQGEREDEMFYDYLISKAPSRDEKEIIASIRDDERRHNKIFRMIYEDFTGEKVPAGEDENLEVPESYLDGIKKALFGELRAVEKYRAIRKRLPMNGPYRDVLFDIITDELKHASKYNYLFTLNSINNNVDISEGFMRQKITKTTGTGSNTDNTTNSAKTTGTGSNVGNTTNSAKTTDTGNNTGSTTSSKNATEAANNTSNEANTIDTSKFTPDEWVRYIRPLVKRALAESQEGINPQHLYEEFILAGVLVGLGKIPQEAIEQVETWEKTGTSKLLKVSKMSRYFS